MFSVESIELVKLFEELFGFHPHSSSVENFNDFLTLLNSVLSLVSSWLTFDTVRMELSVVPASLVSSSRP